MAVKNLVKKLQKVVSGRLREDRKLGEALVRCFRKQNKPVVAIRRSRPIAAADLDWAQVTRCEQADPCGLSMSAQQRLSNILWAGLPDIFVPEIENILDLCVAHTRDQLFSRPACRDG